MCHLYHGKLLVISRGYVFPKLCWSIIMFPMNMATNWGPILHIQTPAYPVSQNPHENPQHIIIPLNHTKSPWNRHQNMFSRDIIYIYIEYMFQEILQVTWYRLVSSIAPQSRRELGETSQDPIGASIQWWLAACHGGFSRAYNVGPPFDS